MPDTTLPRESTAPAARRAERWPRLSLSRRRLSRVKLAQFCRSLSTHEYTLVVHSVDLDHQRYFPNAFVVSKRRDRAANLYTDSTFRDLRLIGPESFGVIVCTGLLEHVSDPGQLVAEFHRILKPGGRLILSASAVFPFHGAPDNFFHFTPNGLRHLFRHWSRVEVLSGSTRPFETMAVLLQRICIQCDLVPLFRPVLTLVYHVVPVLDLLVLRQYDGTSRARERLTDSFMPVTLHAVVTR